MIGGPDEARQVEDLVNPASDTASDIVDLVGRTTIGQTMAVIAGADLVIANDSAPLHVAVGFDRPCVALFGPTDPALVGPYHRPETVVRKYEPRPGETINYRDGKLGDELMRLISVDDVLERVDAVLTGAATPPALEETTT